MRPAEKTERVPEREQSINVHRLLRGLVKNTKSALSFKGNGVIFVANQASIRNPFSPILRELVDQAPGIRHATTINLDFTLSPSVPEENRLKKEIVNAIKGKKWRKTRPVVIIQDRPAVYTQGILEKHSRKG